MECNKFDLEALGWSPFFAAHWPEGTHKPARVVGQSRGLYRVRTGDGECLAELSGRLQYLADSADDLPAAGDWVGIVAQRAGRARIDHLLPRRTGLSRKAAGRLVSEQVVASNMDTVFLVTSLNQEFNLRRMERYLTLIWDGGARPVLLLNKADLCADIDGYLQELERVAIGVSVHVISALAGTGLEVLWQYLDRGLTAAFVGSSGVGKSTIINRLAATSLATQPVREHDDRGRHTTSSRQMIFLSSGGMVIDTPGMRELQLWEGEAGMRHAFPDIANFGQHCKFRDCTHGGEPGCAVEAAILDGRLGRERLESHAKLQAEMRFQARKSDPRIAREDKEKWKRIYRAMRARPKET